MHRRAIQPQQLLQVQAKILQPTGQLISPPSPLSLVNGHSFNQNGVFSSTQQAAPAILARFHTSLIGISQNPEVS